MFATCPQPRAPIRRPLPRPPRNPWPAVLVLVLLIELSLLPLRRPRPAPVPAPVEGAVLITTNMGERPVRRIIPAKPDPTWAKPPCESWQTEISGACWGKMDPAKVRPPCPGGLYEHQGACYAPITKGQRPPTSIGR